MAECYDQFLEHVRQLYSINYGYLVRVRHRLGLGLGYGSANGLGLGFRSGQSQCICCIPPFRKLSYCCKIRNEMQSFHSAVLFRSGNFTNPD